MRHWVCTVLCLGAMCATAASAAGASRTPTLDQSLEMQTVGPPKVSPDGRRVIWEQTRTNWDSNAFETDLWMADAAGHNRHRLTFAPKSSSDAVWSPDGRWIAFLSDRPGALPNTPDGRRQVFLLAVDGGEARQLTRMEKGVSHVAWTPDGRALVLAAEAPEEKASKVRKEAFGDYHVFHADYDMVRLWRLDLPLEDSAGRSTPPGDPKLLTPNAPLSITDFDVSPDGRTVAFSAQKDPDLISSDSDGIYTVGIDGGEVRPVAVARGPNGHPKWSPDGHAIAFETSDGAADYYFANVRVAVVPKDGGAARVLTAAFDEDASLIRWTAQGVWFQARQKTGAGLFLADPAKAQVRPVPLPGFELARGISLSQDGTVAAFAGAGPNRYPDIFATALKAPRPVELSHVGDQLAGFDTSVRELVSWSSTDGERIEGVLYKPRDFDPKKTYPLLVVIHGGPTGVDTPAIAPDRYYPIEQFVARGALVLRPNYRGSAGYGARFRALNVRNLGVGDYADVISGVDALIAKGFVDRDRVGAMGWSEGGYISAFITTSSDRFRAVSVGAGISDWMTYYANTDVTPFTRQYLKATPWDDPQIYARTSPITYVAKARTPTLIQHGGADRRVPIANAFELRQALEDKGVPVKLVVYDGFGHPINKPRQQRAVMAENAAWFFHYIWGEALPAALTPPAAAASTPADSKGP